MPTFKKELTELRDQYALIEVRDCTPEETEEYKEVYEKDVSKLPPEIIVDEIQDDYYKRSYKFRRRINRTDITFEERIEYLQLKQTEHLNSIRNMVLFFVILTCISLVVGVLITLDAFS